MATRAGETEVDPELSITIEQRIVDGPVWHVAIGNGRVRVDATEHPSPTLRLTSDHATAAAIHAGTLSAQRAFLDGELQIGGDISELIANRAAFDTVADLLAEVT